MGPLNTLIKISVLLYQPVITLCSFHCTSKLLHDALKYAATYFSECRALQKVFF